MISTGGPFAMLARASLMLEAVETEKPSRSTSAARLLAKSASSSTIKALSMESSRFRSVTRSRNRAAVNRVTGGITLGADIGKYAQPGRLRATRREIR